MRRLLMVYAWSCTRRSKDRWGFIAFGRKRVIQCDASEKASALANEAYLRLEEN